ICAASISFLPIRNAERAVRNPVGFLQDTLHASKAPRNILCPGRAGKELHDALLRWIVSPFLACLREWHWVWLAQPHNRNAASAVIRVGELSIPVLGLRRSPALFFECGIFLFSSDLVRFGQIWSDLLRLKTLGWHSRSSPWKRTGHGSVEKREQARRT